MLTLTENAQSAVDDVATRADLPAGGGLRIARSAVQPGGLELALTPAPESTDQVIQTTGTPVFVDADAADQLDELVLDTAPAPTPDAEPGFVLTPKSV
ncbi:Fe-S cluster assembly iron-binding protein IscA [Salana multivorans]|uniref:Fe-S cluster assembly iron-binding protein IscA n=1 Tax=Salana multivorans TaxID=120377 RepID=A0A3N2D8J4_9MICO|nr:Fe-S cluster assembly protein HesB [Salana multivorans]OJX97506.1 MAG: Fe-S cluster assembly protein HesB [Micrococcales bacterium 73-15]ROR96106.1 Fe-S cluster assembly iron-binding protein IscA [Salana multivorans]